MKSKSQFHIESKIMQNVKGNQSDHKSLKSFIDVYCWKIYGCLEKEATCWTLQPNIGCCWHSPHEFSSEPSAQSFSPLQKSPRSMQFPSPQARNPSWQSGSSVTNSGFTLRSLFLSLQFLTASFQSQVCLSISKKRPAGQRIACRPCSLRVEKMALIWNLTFVITCMQLLGLRILTEVVHWMTSRQESPSLATNRNHSPASLSLHSSCSNVSSVFLPSDLSSCRLTRSAFAGERKMENDKNKIVIRLETDEKKVKLEMSLLTAVNELMNVFQFHHEPFTFSFSIGLKISITHFKASHLFVKFKRQTKQIFGFTT